MIEVMLSPGVPQPDTLSDGPPADDDKYQFLLTNSHRFMITAPIRVFLIGHIHSFAVTRLRVHCRRQNGYV